MSYPDPNYHHKIAPGTQFEPELDRYVLYVAITCPFAQRALLVRSLKGLEHVIRVVYTHPIMGAINDEGRKGWVFGHPENKPVPGPIADLLKEYPLVKDANGVFQPPDGVELSQAAIQHLRIINPTNELIDGFNTTDTVTHKRTLREVYQIDNPSFEGKFTVPLLFDAKTNKIVNTESAEIIQILDTSFQSFARNPNWSLVPASTTEAEVTEACNKMAPGLNFSVYKVGFAPNQIAYLNAQEQLYRYLDDLNDLLTKQRFICGSEVSEADIRAIVTLVRFDPVCNCLFKLGKRISDYPAISDYLADIWQNILPPEAQASYNELHIKYGYFCGQDSLNKAGIVPTTAPIDFNRKVEYRQALGKGDTKSE